MEQYRGWLAKMFQRADAVHNKLPKAEMRERAKELEWDMDSDLPEIFDQNHSMHNSLRHLVRGLRRQDKYPGMWKARDKEPKWFTVWMLSLIHI